jgi:four helix bundle protein
VKKNDLTDRLLKFSIDVILFLRRVPNTEEYQIIKRQLIKSSTSAGANYEEAQGGSSTADFVNKVRISLKEMRESSYWLKIMHGISLNVELETICIELINESNELKNILGAICKNTSRKLT